MVMADRGDRERATFAGKKPWRKDRDYESSGGNGGHSGGRRGDRYGNEPTGGGGPSTPRVLVNPRILSKSSNQDSEVKSRDEGAQALRNDINHVDRGGGGYDPPLPGLGGGGGAPVVMLRKDNGGSTVNHVMRRAGGVESQSSASKTTPHTTTVSESSRARLVLPPVTSQSVKLIDESFNWCDAPFELMLDQSNFLVIGCVGTQGVGKSTIMSYLASSSRNLLPKMYTFRQQSKETRDSCAHMTAGVHMSVTQERTILLDSQALLSSSVQDCLNQMDTKYSNDFAINDNSVQLQSMQIATFMMTVCHIVIVVADDFTDINFMRMLRMAEMLKPTTPNQKNSMAGYEEYYPYIVFLQNRCDAEGFGYSAVHRLDSLINLAMKDSKLYYYGLPKLGLVNRGKQKNKNKTSGDLEEERVNLVLLPVKSTDNLPKTDSVKTSSTQVMTSGYRGSPAFDEVMGQLRRVLLSIPRKNLTHTSLSEKNWFHYASSSWNVVHKQQQLTEYVRLLS